MARTSIKIDQAELQRLGARMAEQAKVDPSGLMPRLGEYLMRSTEQRFKTQTAPDGTAWAPLSPNYAKSKKYNKDKILTLRGYLRRYIQYQVPEANTVEVGSNLKYAAIHQFGGIINQAAQSRRMRFRSVNGKTLFAGNKHKRATERWVERGAYQAEMPARPYLGISAKDDKAIREIIQGWISERGLR